MNNKTLREECKWLKVFQDINYKEISEYLGIKPASFYSWLNGYYDFGYTKQKILYEIICDLKE